jgi:hypothetical protein
MAGHNTSHLQDSTWCLLSPRIAWRKGASVAVFATARKLAQIVYRLIRFGQSYVDGGADAYEARNTQRRLASYTRALKQMGYTIEPLTSCGTSPTS